MVKTYSAEIASTGHKPVHMPQSIHVEESITLIPSVSLIAFTGHSLSHAPQLMQSEQILCAITFTSLSLLYVYRIVTCKSQLAQANI